MTCWRCNGTGEIQDPLVLGQALRKLRMEAEITLHRMAAVLGISAGYLSDLENGKRGWLGEVTPDRYCDALDAEIERLKTQSPEQRKGRRKDTGLDSPDEQARNEAWLGKRD